MRRSSVLLPLVLAAGCPAFGAFTTGCTAEPPPAAATHGELSNAGLDLHGTGADDDLQVRFTGTTVVVSRGGESFQNGACERNGAVEGTRTTSRLQCRFAVAMPVPASVGFAIVEEAGAYRLEDIRLYGVSSEISTQLRILVGERDPASLGPGFELRLARRGGSMSRLENPFLDLVAVGRAISGLVERSFYAHSTSEAIGENVPVARVTYALRHAQVEATAWAQEDQHHAWFRFSPFESPEDAGSAQASLEEIERRAVAALPAPRVCEDGLSPVTAADAVTNAITPVAGPSFGLVENLPSWSAAPPAVRHRLREAISEIGGTVDPGLRYDFHFVAIRRSCADASVVAFAIWGRAKFGSGLPSTVIAFDPAGQRIHVASGG